MPREAGFRHNEETRNKIKTAQLINRLQEHVFSEKPILDPGQVNAAKTLLNKVLPDLKAMELSGDPNSPIVHRIERRIVDPK